MSDTIHISATVASLKNQAYQTGQATVGETKVDIQSEVQSIAGASAGGSKGEYKLPQERQQEEKEKKFEIDILPLDEPMTDKISHAIDETFYGEKKSGVLPEEHEPHVDGYGGVGQPVANTLVGGKAVDIKG